MARCIHKVILIAMATDCTGVGGITHRLAGWRCGAGFVVVRQYRNGFSVGLTTVYTSKRQLTFVRAGCFLCHTLLIMVICRLDVCIHVAMTADRAGMGRVPHLVACGLSHYHRVAVTQFRRHCIHVGMPTGFASIGGITGGFAGWFRHSRLVLVACSGNQTADIAVATAGAGQFGIAHVLASGSHSGLLIVMS